MANKVSSINSSAVPGASSIPNGVGSAIIGGALALGGAAIIGSAFYKTPDVIKQSKYLGNMTFPNDLIDPAASRNYYMAIQFVEYQRRSIFNQPFMQATGGVYLPIPNNLKDTQQVTYEESQADAATGAGIEAALQGRNGVGGSSLSSISPVAGIAGIATGAATKAVGNIASGLGIDTQQALQLGGLAQNPFLTILFKSPNFKRHTFSWKLSPNNNQESNTLRDIIQTFRSNMLPALQPNAGGTLLAYPNMAIITLYPNNAYTYLFKPCVIENMTVDFAPNGIPSFYKNTDAPTEVTISLSLLEIEYWLKEDVEGSQFRTAAAAIFSGTQSSNTNGQ